MIVRSCCISRFASLSARRAWIEISNAGGSAKSAEVALRKESVDRNGYVGVLVVLWALVALRKESVDRNIGGRP